MSSTLTEAEPARPEVRRPRLQFTSRAAILAVVVTALLFYLVVPLRTYIQQRDRLAQLVRQEKVLEQRNRQLVHQIQELQDPAYIERIARECLGMIKQGEIGFVVVPRNGTASPPPDC